jgi:putative transcriptional regulator
MILVRTLVIKQPEASQLLREIRSHVGVTQEQLALHLGVTYSTINRWENQRGKPSPLAVQKIEAMLEQMGDRGRELRIRYLTN